MPPSRATRGVVALGLAVALALTSTSCTSAPLPWGGRTVHAEGEGPLSAGRGVGGNSLTAPDARHWTGMFGAFVLCAQEPGASLEVQSIAAETSVGPVEVVPMVRTTTPDALRHLRPAERAGYTPTYGALGSPPDFDEPYIDAVVPGAYSTQVSGWHVDQTCEETRALEAQISGGEVPDGALKELVFSVSVGPRGGEIDEVAIEYLADGRPMTLTVPWQMIACGAAITTPDACQR